MPLLRFLNERKSCEPYIVWMEIPTHMNKRALNIACVTKWKKHIFFWFKDREIIITPNWDKVDKATIFLMSNSTQALAPAISIVILPITNIHSIENKLNRSNKYTPAVTKVEEWTKALTGVGAAIAEGNQDEKGICALLVMEVNRSNTVIR